MVSSLLSLSGRLASSTVLLLGLLLVGDGGRLRRSSADLNAARLQLLLLHLRHHHRQHAAVHLRRDVVQIGTLREPELAHEAPAAALHAVPGIRLLHLLLLPLPADAQRAPVLDLHPHVLLAQARQVGLEHVLRGRLLPVHARAGHGARVASERGRGGVVEERHHRLQGVGHCVPHVVPAPEERRECHCSL
ncbi:hypothetical protein KC19_4G068200 [Ceratodon purpureus]|uniref:Uncharacterized protein n=1 Tax=Ceratodon purpureus TaxID=3225 RepID=A0A8T0I7T5_CERPU|nr:hypothetical protein KC19_4G068200 [Ceratodon purpureus]